MHSNHMGTCTLTVQEEGSVGTGSGEARRNVVLVEVGAICGRVSAGEGGAIKRSLTVKGEGDLVGVFAVGLQSRVSWGWNSHEKGDTGRHVR